jgi:hypothetical protein
MGFSNPKSINLKQEVPRLGWCLGLCLALLNTILKGHPNKRRFRRQM